MRYLLVLSCLLWGCSAETAEDEDGLGEDQGALEDVGPRGNDDIGQADYETLGLGVGYKDVGQGGNNALIVYGGYSAKDVYVQRWADELARVKGNALGIRHVYAVRGPNQAGYGNREIANSKLVAHLAANGRADNASSIIVLAHSSGAFVAGEFLSQLKARRGGISADAIGKVTLFNLDGGGTDGAALRMTKNTYFVYGCDSNLGRCSHNADAMKSLGSTYRSLGGALKVDATGSGCGRSNGGLWCLHDTLINTRPHNPNMYDLARDYTRFGGSHKLVTSFLEVLER